jgi:hypothetical protein
MRTKDNTSQVCALCGKSFPQHKLISGEIVRKEITAEILKTLPEWNPEKFICRPDLAQVRGCYVHASLESGKGELSALEQEVVKSMREHEVLSENVDAEFEQQWSHGERMADRIATFGGRLTPIPSSSLTCCCPAWLPSRRQSS